MLVRLGIEGSRIKPTKRDKDISEKEYKELLVEIEKYKTRNPTAPETKELHRLDVSKLKLDVATDLSSLLITTNSIHQATNRGNDTIDKFLPYLSIEPTPSVSGRKAVTCVQAMELINEVQHLRQDVMLLVNSGAKKEKPVVPPPPSPVDTAIYEQLLAKAKEYDAKAQEVFKLSYEMEKLSQNFRKEADKRLPTK
jgi:hypothetical protein